MKPSQPLIISMDNDSNPQTRERVTKAAKQLADGLKALSIDCYTENVSGAYKDANEFLNACGEADLNIRNAEEAIFIYSIKE